MGDAEEKLSDSINWINSTTELSELKKYMEDFLNNLDAEESVKKKIKDNINNPRNDISEIKKACVIASVIKLSAGAQANEIAKGAHVTLKDGGALYRILKESGLGFERISSHHGKNKSEKDLGIQGGNIFREFLIGKTEDGKSWFQLEAHSTKGGLKNLIAHLMDYLMYKITGKNIGQYGLSSYTDNKPIEIHEIKKSIDKKYISADVEAHRPKPSQDYKNERKGKRR